MAVVIFFEKPGCATNTKQKRLLAASGHEVVAKDLLTEPWSGERLASFFAGLAVDRWFNRAAPKVKSGEIVPESLEPAAALALLVAEPLLIRRPLIEVDGKRMAGFDRDRLKSWIGLTDPGDAVPEGCSHEGRVNPTCPPPAGGSPCGAPGSGRGVGV